MWSGRFIIAYAAEFLEEANFIGVDHAAACLQRAIKKANDAKLSNLLFYSGDAIDFLKREMPPNVFDLLVINFPDPWPKRRHHKRRIITPQSAQTLAYSLKPKGELHTSTDVSSLDASQRSILVSSGHLQWRDSRTYSGQSLETSAFKFL